MRIYYGVDVYIQVSLIAALYGGEWSDSLSGLFILWKEPPYSLDRRLGRPRIGMEDMGK
jgi:hypothetical protein